MKLLTPQLAAWFLFFIFSIISTPSASGDLVASAASNVFHHIKVHSITEAMPYFEDADEYTLALIDVDATLTIPTDPYLQPHIIFHERHKDIYYECVSELTQDQLYFFNHLWCIESASQLLESEFLGIIESFQKKSGNLGLLRLFQTHLIKKKLLSTLRRN